VRAAFGARAAPRARPPNDDFCPHSGQFSSNDECVPRPGTKSSFTCGREAARARRPLGSFPSVPGQASPQTRAETGALAMLARA
jgi:hypothetical protein